MPWEVEYTDEFGQWWHELLEGQQDAVTASSPSEKHGWRVFGGMMGPVQ